MKKTTLILILLLLSVWSNAQSKHDTIPARLMVSKLPKGDTRQTLFIVEGYAVYDSRYSLNRKPKTFLDENKRDICHTYYVWDFRRYELPCGCEEEYHQD